VKGRCCSCGTGLVAVADLGMQHTPDFPPQAEYVAREDPQGKAYSLRLMLCQRCTLLQLAEATPRDVLYHSNYGFKSGVNEAIVADLADVALYACEAFSNPSSWLDIACNDGTLLSHVAPHVHRVGIDPMMQFAAEASRHGTIVSDFFSPRYFTGQLFDVVTSVSMFYDLADPNEFVEGVREVLSTHGVWVIQQNYALDMLTSNAVDNICHEHVTYFTVRALWDLLHRAGLEINDVAYSSVNGGCFRTLVSHRGRRTVADSVWRALELESEAGLGDPRTYRDWMLAVRAELQRTSEFLADCKAAGKSVYVYGASTRGGTLLQLMNAGPDLLPYAVDRNPAKVGAVMAATGIPIISEEEMRLAQPDYLLVSPWFFRDVFLEREKDYLAAGGKMVFPLPAFEVVGA
jgi:NDP-4-keto-2,6-dideoxyhexose 3-C-methyltransferase